MNIAGISKLEKLLIDNSPSVLTTIGVVGTVTTAALTGRATYSAVLTEVREYYDVNDFFNDREKRPGNINRKTAQELAKKHWKLYAPAVGAGVLTIAAIVGANRVGNRRAAGLAAAVTLSERAYSEYKDKVVEKLGVNKERAIRDEIAQDRVNQTPGSNQVIIAGTEVLCLDLYTGRYFKSDKQILDAAQNKINADIIHNSYASLSDLYNLLDIPTTSVSDEVGWNSEVFLDIKYSSALTPDGKPCLAVDYSVGTIRDYWRNN